MNESENGNEGEKERLCAMYRVAGLLAENGQDENEAVKGYTSQLQAIEAARALTEEGTPEAAMLDRFFSATQEKIADELNHAQSLLREYTELTGILPAEE